MLVQYEHDHKTGMDLDKIATEIHKHTSGYPFLVSRICQCIHEELDQDWSTTGIYKAIKIIKEEKNTLLDDLYKNVYNNQNLAELMKRLLLDGERISYNQGIPEIDLGTMYGYFDKDDERGLVISNKIFENILIEYFVDLAKIRRELPAVHSVHNEFVVDGRFDMQACLEKFAKYYPELYSAKNAEFLERDGQLIFLMHLLPALNGRGHHYVESHTRNEERMDLVINFAGEEFILELKKWRGTKKHEAAYEQLAKYLDARNTDTGYLLTFDFRKNKEQKSGWVEYQGKKIFDVMV
jgi:hypothetical protein